MGRQATYLAVRAEAACGLLHQARPERVYTPTAGASNVALKPDDHKDLPFDGGSEPVPQVREPVPGPGRSAMQYVVIGVCVLIALATVLMLFAW